jgi:hypothetical protein
MCSKENTPAPKSNNPRSERVPSRMPDIPSGTHRPTSSLVPLCRPRHPSEVCAVLLFLLVQTMLGMEPCSSRSSKLRRAPPPEPLRAAVPPPLDRLLTSPAVHAWIRGPDPPSAQSNLQHTGQPSFVATTLQKQHLASSNHPYTLPPTEILTFKSLSLCLDPQAFMFFPNRL